MVKRKKRDMQATAKTLAFFVSRDGKPTSIKQAARHLKVPPSRIHNVVANLAKNKELIRVDRGVYVEAKVGVQQLSLPLPDANQQLLESLLKEREHLDAKIEKVREVIALHQEKK